MKAIIFAVLSMLFYALAYVLIEQKLSKLNNLTIIVVYTSVVLILSLTLRQITKTDDVSFNFPHGKLLLILIAVGVLFAFADYFFIGAFTNGVHLVVITSIIALVPVISSFFKFLLTKETPNLWEISGYVMALVAVILIAKGSIK